VLVAFCAFYRPSNDCPHCAFKSLIVVQAEEQIISAKYTAALCFIAFIFSYITLILFRYCIKYIIWIVYCSFIAMLASGGIAFIIAGLMLAEGSAFFLAGGMFIFVALIFCGVLYYFRKKIRLVAKLFKEASKALIDIPGILFEPILVRCD
jgi:solute carrier family 44 protein 1 (choline transporter-like protein)